MPTIDREMPKNWKKKARFFTCRSSKKKRHIFLAELEKTNLLLDGILKGQSSSGTGRKSMADALFYVFLLGSSGLYGLCWTQCARIELEHVQTDATRFNALRRSILFIAWEWEALHVYLCVPFSLLLWRAGLESSWVAHPVDIQRTGTYFSTDGLFPRASAKGSF